MRTILLIILTCFLIAGSLAQGLPAQEQQHEFDQASLREPGPLSPLQETALQLRQKVIVDEAAKMPEDEWVGTYSLEDGLTSGARFDWAPTNGFVVRWNTCSHGLRDKINFGNVSVRDGLLYLAPKLQGEGGKLYAVAADLVRVKWGQQHYLIPSDQMIAFCYAALNAGRSLEINEFFLRRSDREKQRFGLPSVPQTYKKFLVGNPIQAKIIELKSQPHEWGMRFILNMGRKAGVVPRMKFFATSPRSVYMLVEVVAVTDQTSEVFVITSGFKNGAENTVNPQVGWRFTSRAPRGAYNYYPG